MTYTVSTRRLTPPEEEKFRRTLRFSLDDWTWVLAPGPSLGILGYIIGIVVEWFLALFGLDIKPYARIGLMIPGLVVGLVLMAYLYHVFKGKVSDTKADLKNGLVQILHVVNAAVIQQQEYNDEGPIY